ncbi:MAG: MBL fold metallo-hydrolase [Syntrophomonadaceae bacterium]|nr:MBL fold metallo-hydrolase [Syntrophomonadaceae bacterium]
MRISDHVIQLGNRHFNYFIVGQKEAAVIECGVTGGVASLSDQWEKIKEKPEVRYLVASHAHFDHVCGIPSLRRLFPEAKVMASAEAGKVLSKSKIVRNFFEQDEEMSSVLINESVLDYAPASPHPEIIEVDRIIEGGEDLSLAGGINLQVIEAPGHSPCNLAFYLPREQIMFVSDTAGFQISDDSLFPIFFQGYELYMESLEKLKGYPTRVLAVPHEKIWSGSKVEAFYDRAIRDARTAFINIEKRLDSGWDDEAIKSDLFAYYYRGNLRIYNTANISLCVELLLRRVKECL